MSMLSLKKINFIIRKKINEKINNFIFGELELFFIKKLFDIFLEFEVKKKKFYKNYFNYKTTNYFLTENKNYFNVVYLKKYDKDIIKINKKFIKFFNEKKKIFYLFFKFYNNNIFIKKRIIKNKNKLINLINYEYYSKSSKKIFANIFYKEQFSKDLLFLKNQLNDLCFLKRNILKKYIFYLQKYLYKF